MENSRSSLPFEKYIFEKYAQTLLDGRYRLEKILGTGGMSVVFRAYDTQGDRTVAIKMLRDEIAGEREAVERFLNESRAVSMLSHPNIVDIHDVSVDTEHKYLVMEYVEGVSLRAYMDKRGALPPREIIAYTEQILSALVHAHSRGVIHRDIKPQNIMLLKDGAVKVMDFGIAKLPKGAAASADALLQDKDKDKNKDKDKDKDKDKKDGSASAGGSGGSGSSDSSDSSDKTVGTVYYISPEQAQNCAADERSDLYSLGVMMYEMLTGRLPFDDESPISVVLMHMNDRPDPPHKISKDVPRGLEQLILYAMEKKPQKRYRSAADMLRELRRIKKDPSRSVYSPARIEAFKRSSRNRAQNKPSRSMTPIIMGVAFALLIVGLVSLFYAFDQVVGGMTTKTLGVKIPEFSGLDREMCAELLRGELERQGLRDGDVVLVYDEQYSEDAAAGCAIEQYPTAGSHKKVPCTVNITLSLGPQMLTMPDYTISDWRTAKSELRGMGFIVKVVEEANAAVQSGYVIMTDPAPGARLIAGSEVTVRVSRGRISGAVGSVELPSFVGLGEAAVMTKLGELGLTVGEVIYTRSPQPIGTVLGQYPAEGSEAIPGIDPVSFAVSGGAEHATEFIPDVTGMSRADAVALLATYGLHAARVRSAASELPLGTVIAQSPGGSTEISAGFGYSIDPDTESVVLTISAGKNYTPTAVSFIMPRITGKTLAGARETLALYGADIGYIWYVRSDKPAGTVIDQMTPQGVTVSGYPGEITVDVTVSGGEEYTNNMAVLTVPDVMGLTLSVAKERLFAAKLIWYITEVESPLPAGTVIDQSPEGGESLHEREWEEIVMLTVSAGTSAPPATEPVTEPVTEPEPDPDGEVND